MGVRMSDVSKSSSSGCKETEGLEDRLLCAELPPAERALRNAYAVSSKARLALTALPRAAPGR